MYWNRHDGLVSRRRSVIDTLGAGSEDGGDGGYFWLTCMRNLPEVVTPFPRIQIMYTRGSGMLKALAYMRHLSEMVVTSCSEPRTRNPRWKRLAFYFLFACGRWQAVIEFSDVVLLHCSFGMSSRTETNWPSGTTSKIVNHNPKSINHGPETLNQKPETRNPAVNR